MNTESLPFMHFMLRIDDGRRSYLVSPNEAVEDTQHEGCFVVPVSESGKLYPAYRFHFSIYLGNGSFLSTDNRKHLFLGLAIHAAGGQKYALITAFEWFVLEWLPPGRMAHLLRFPKVSSESLVPTFQRVRRREGRLRYGGQLMHRDFDHTFAEIRPTDPVVLDTLLETCGISIIGCDPFTSYEGARKTQ